MRRHFSLGQLRIAPHHRPGYTWLLALLTWVAAAFVATLVPAPLHAQAASATLSGNVTDESGASIADAEIGVRGVANALERHVVTDRGGSFVVTLLPPGQYSVTARRQGFATSEIRDVVLNVNDQLSIGIQLKVQSPTESVTVVAEPSRSNVAPGVGTVVDRQFVANVPLNGRTLHALLQLVPGVVLTPAAGSNSSATGTAQFSVNGQRTTANYFMVDGVSANSGIAAFTLPGAPGQAGAGQTAGTTALGGTNSLVSLDALQEVRIETSTFGAEFGRTPGGQISLVTRSGTNVLHGSGSEYFRDTALNANDWFANSRGLAKPEMRQHLFSGVLGGPVLPARAFYFVSYEALRLQQPKTTLTSVPTEDVRAQAPVALRPYLNALPLPNGRTLAPGTAEFSASYSDPASFDIWALRLDTQMTSALTSFVRISHAPSETHRRTASLSTVSNAKITNDAVTAGATWVAGSRVTADLRANWTRNQPRLSNELTAFGGGVVPGVSEVFLPGKDPSRESFFFNAIGAFLWGPGSQDVQRQLNVVGVLAWLLGGHHLKVGVDYRRLTPLFGGEYGSGEVLYFADAQRIVNGRASYYSLSSATPDSREALFSNLSVYAQDTWRAARRLTLTYGVRFEHVPPPTEANGLLPRTVLGIENDVLQNPRLAAKGTPMWRGRAGELAPRLGIAHQIGLRPGWETTLRSGVGVFYDLGLGNMANAFQFTYPFVASNITFNVPFPLPDGVRVPPTPGTGAPTTLWLADPALRLPYTVQWNAAFEQALGPAQTVTVAYVGSAGRRLLILQNYFQALAEWPDAGTQLYVQRNLGRSTYRGLQMQYQRRLHNGLQALASYALAHSEDNTSAAEAIAPPASRAELLAREWAPSDFDVRHQLAMALTYDRPARGGTSTLQRLSAGWGGDLLVRVQSALPVNPAAGYVSINGSYFIPRPDIVPGQPLYENKSSVPGGRRFNRGAFVAPAQNQQGTFPRNGLRGFAASQVDVGLRREVGRWGRLRIQMKAEIFNVLNQPNFGQPIGNLSDALFGQPTQMLNSALGGLNALYQMGGPRSGELTVKALF